MKKKVVALLLGMSLAVSGSVWAAGYTDGEEININLKETVNSEYQLEYGRFGLQREIKESLLGSLIEIYDKNENGVLFSLGKVETLGSAIDSDYIYMPNDKDNMYGKICNGKAEIIVSDVRSYWGTDDGRMIMFVNKDGKSGIYDTLNKKILDIDSYKFDKKSYVVYQNVNGASYLIIVQGDSQYLDTYKNGEVYCRKVTVLNVDTMKSVNTVISASHRDKVSIKMLSKEKNIMLLMCEDHRGNSSDTQTIIINPDGEAKLLEFEGYEFNKLYGPTAEDSYNTYGEGSIDDFTIVYRKHIEDYANKFIFYFPEKDEVITLKGTYSDIRPFDEGKAVARIKGNDNTIVLDESENILEILDYEHYIYDVMLDEKTNKPVYISNYRYSYSSDYRYTVNLFTDGVHSNFKLDMKEPDRRVNKVVDGVVYYDQCSFKPVKNDQGKISYEKEDLAIENYNNLSDYVDIKLEETDNFIFKSYEIKFSNDVEDFLIISNKLGDTVLKVDEFYDYNYVKEINKNAIAYEKNGKDHIYFVKEKEDVEIERDLIAYSKDLTLKNVDSVLSIKYDNGDYIIADNKGKKIYPEFAADSIRRVNDTLYFYEANNDYYGVIKVKEDGSLEIEDAIYSNIEVIKSSSKIIVKNMIGLVGALDQDGKELIKPEFDSIEYITDKLFITRNDNKFYLHRIIK